jgi:toxin YhaV
MEANGWKLYGHKLFIDQFKKLLSEVSELQYSDPTAYESHPKAKFLATINRLIRETIPEDPTAPEFRQGNTLGKINKHWFRAKFHGRYRLFFRFSSQHRIIVYTWLNDEKTLRKAGAKTDPYIIFQSMLKSGNPPQDFEQLFKKAIPLDGDQEN